MEPFNRPLTAISHDNHQPWIWVTHFFILSWVLLVLFLRVRGRRRLLAMSDAVLAVAHFLYLAYWFVLLFALIQGLGKAEKLVTAAQEVKVSKLVFASRILLVAVVSLTQLSTVYLIQEIFTKSTTKWWFPIIAGAAAFEFVAGSLLVSVRCSPSHVVYAQENSQCAGNTARWIVLTVIEAIIELVLVIPVGQTVATLQTRFQNKFLAFSVFAVRLSIYVPLWYHVAEYVAFMGHGRTNIDLVPTIVIEEFWLCAALVSASVPVLMRIAKKFTTSGVQIGNTTLHQSRQRTENISQLASLKSRRGRNGSIDGNMVLQSGQHGIHTVSINAALKGDGASIGSNAESHVGILRRVDVEVSSDQDEHTTKWVEVKQ